MGESIAHRGPDAAGFWFEGNVGFVHRRLSILDLSEAGTQPFYSQDQNHVLVFNGEIFNFKEFYPELKSKGYSFHSTSDTEVLLYLLMEYGMEVLGRLNGFFAFAYYNRQKEELYLARDRFGVKPLFYVESDQELQKVVQEAKTELGETGRVLLRASGTEPLVRVMVEAQDVGTAQSWAERIARVVEKQLKLS